MSTVCTMVQRLGRAGIDRGEMVWYPADRARDTGLVAAQQADPFCSRMSQLILHDELPQEIEHQEARSLVLRARLFIHCTRRPTASCFTGLDRLGLLDNGVAQAAVRQRRQRRCQVRSLCGV